MKKALTFKLLFSVLILLLLTFICACDNSIHYWNCDQPWENVNCVKIVDAKNAYEYTVLSELSDDRAKELYYEIENLPMKRYGLELLTPRGICFLIEFKNGDYDFISKIEPEHCRQGEDRIMCYTSWLYVDEESWESIINKYYCSDSIIETSAE